MLHKDKIVIQKILREIGVGEEILKDITLETFLEDEKLKRATSMTVINIGELVKNVSDELRVSHPEIPWKEMAGIRDVAAHRYLTLRMEDVYNTMKNEFIEIREKILKIPTDVESDS